MKKEAYHYKASGLDNIYLLNGFTFHEDEGYGRSVSFHDIEGLHRAIGTMLINAQRPLTGKELRFLRHELELTQDAAARMFGVSVQTVANWEKGKTTCIPVADRLIRILYIEHIQANPHVADLLERLSQAVAEKEGKAVFKQVHGDWKRAA